jgi:adenosylmethionine-8-amino-7-oxononanoate aminotransferase
MATPDRFGGWPAAEVSVLAHGPTFMANPLTAAVALASIDLLLSQDWRGEVDRLAAGVRHGLVPAARLRSRLLS